MPLQAPLGLVHYRVDFISSNTSSAIMVNLIHAMKSVLRWTPAFQVYLKYQHRKFIQKWIRDWVQAGQPIPQAELIKHQVAREYAERFALSVFVETGTHVGMMVNAVKDVFEQIYSIELSKDLYKYAKKRFKGANHIIIMQGDSGEMLKRILPQVNRPCLFYLDAHYSGGITARSNLETPIESELNHIFGHPLRHRHVILIDDARCFTGEHDYPTIEKLREASNSAGCDSFEVKDDIIRIHKLSRSGSS